MKRANILCCPSGMEESRLIISGYKLPNFYEGITYFTNHKKIKTDARL